MAQVHAWNYRRYILASMPVARDEKSELAYTTRKIEGNISNFSAWHQRSKVIGSLLDGGQLSKDAFLEKGELAIETLERSEMRGLEFELVRNAMYTDPNDQSVWMYHRWLVGLGERLRLVCCTARGLSTGSDKKMLEREIEAIKELLLEELDSRCG